MTLGRKIAEARKQQGVRGYDLAAKIGRSTAILSDIENDRLKGGPSPEIVVKIAESLNDHSILLHYLEENPVYRAIIPRIFPELNNIRREPAIIFSRFAAEASEAVESARILAEVFSNAEPRRTPNFDALFKAHLEQIVDVQRCAEVLFTALIAAHVMTEDELRGVHERQQRKCEKRGHHLPAQEVA